MMHVDSEIQMLTAKDVAVYLLRNVDEEKEVVITPLKLQKLVYYCQGAYLAAYSSKLFAEDLEAWEHGPVVPSLWREYNRYGSGAIPAPPMVDLATYTQEQRDIIDHAYEVFGQYSAWKLRNDTHTEQPWLEAYPGKVISPETMQTYFKVKLSRMGWPEVQGLSSEDRTEFLNSLKDAPEPTPAALAAVKRLRSGSITY